MLVIASMYMGPGTYILHVYYVCNPVVEGSRTERSMGDGFIRYLTVSHAVEACHVQQPLNPAHVTIRQLVCLHKLCKSIVYMCV